MPNKFFRLSGILALCLGMTFCSKDDKTTEEPMDSQSQTEPAAPPPIDDASMEPFHVETVYFAFDSSNLSSESQAKLNNLADHLQKNASVTVQIEGHCDERGTVQYNLALGERRALAVKGFLTNLGVGDNRITTISYGEEKPVDVGHDESAWSKNRRAEFVLSN